VAAADFSAAAVFFAGVGLDDALPRPVAFATAFLTALIADGFLAAIEWPLLGSGVPRIRCREDKRLSPPLQLAAPAVTMQARRNQVCGLATVT
jgi:hypothetical protein